MLMQVGDEFTASANEQQRQLESLRTLVHYLEQSKGAHARALAGLQVRLYHPDVAQFDMADVHGVGHTMQVSSSPLLCPCSAGDVLATQCAIV